MRNETSLVVFVVAKSVFFAAHNACRSSAKRCLGSRHTKILSLPAIRGSLIPIFVAKISFSAPKKPIRVS